MRVWLLPCQAFHADNFILQDAHCYRPNGSSSGGQHIPPSPAQASKTHLDEVVDIDFAILILIQRRGQADQLVFWNVLDLFHGTDELCDTDDVLPRDTACMWTSTPNLPLVSGT